MNTHTPYRLLLCVLLFAAFACLIGCSNSSSDTTADGDISLIDGDNVDSEAETLPDGDGFFPSDGDRETEDEAIDSDTEIEYSPFDCEGSCTGDDPDACFENNLCSCKAGRFHLDSCESICNFQGYATTLGCAFDAERNAEVCLCETSPTQCAADITITTLPFNITTDTTRTTNRFDVTDSCFEWSLMGPDRIFSIDLPAGSRITATLTPQTVGYDPALTLAAECSDRAICLAGSDRRWECQPNDCRAESMSFSSQESRVYFLVVDSGYSADAEAARGAFELDVTGVIVDGDTDDEAEEDGDLDRPEMDMDIEVETEAEEDGDLDRPEMDMDIEVETEAVEDSDLEFEAEPPSELDTEAWVEGEWEEVGESDSETENESED